MFFGDILTYIILLSFVVVFLFWYKRLDRSFKILALSSFLDVFCLVISSYLQFQGKNNWAIHHFGVHEQFILLGAAFYFIFQDVRLKKGVILLGSIYCVFSILDTIYLEPFHMAPGNIQVIGSLCGILCAFGLFYEIFREEKVLYIEHDHRFWLSTSVLSYFGASLFISLFLNYLVHDLPLWMYDLFLYIDLFLFFLSKAALLYGAYLLIRKDRTEQLSSQNIHLIKRAA